MSGSNSLTATSHKWYVLSACDFQPSNQTQIAKLHFSEILHAVNSLVTCRAMAHHQMKAFTPHIIRPIIKRE